MRPFSRFLRPVLGRLVSTIKDPIVADLDRLKVLQGQIAARQVAALGRLPSLGAAGFRVSSQWGEDGIVEWIVSRLPAIDPSFVEFGVETYREANTLFLLQHRNWRGLIADADAGAIADIKRRELMWRHDLTPVCQRITPGNIDALFTANGFGGELGILSIDIDGIDYWVWEAISAVRPALVICEYNAVFGDLHAITVPRDDAFARSDRHHSNLYWGASITALQRLAQRKGYVLLGSNTEGNNAFFLREELAGDVAALIDDRRPRPSLFRESRGADGRLTYLGGTDRLAPILGMPVHDVDRNVEVALGDLGELYSDAWRRVFDRRGG